MIATSSPTLAAVVRKDFPILQQEVHGKPLIYFDNAASSQKPDHVIKTWMHYYQQDNANVHRGAHTLSNRATEAFEGAREKIAAFIHARSAKEIIYTRNASEAINLVARSWGEAFLQPGDEIILSVMEHHSNIVPWQFVAQKTGAVLRYVTLTPQGEFDMAVFESLLSPRTKLVATAHVSNVLGCITPVEAVIALAHQRGAKVLIDACQSVPHMGVDVQAMDCDWLVASGHKMCAPTGIGFLYGKTEVLEAMPPFLGGGEMISEVFLDRTSFAELPHKFEAGTPAIGEAIALGAAVEYLTKVGMDKIHAYEEELTQHLVEEMLTIPGLTFYGPLHKRAGLLAFTAGQGIHANDIATFLDQEGIAIRSGHHCAQPLHNYLGINGTARASLYLYNTHSEIDRFVQVLKETLRFFQQIM